MASKCQLLRWASEIGLFPEMLGLKESVMDQRTDTAMYETKLHFSPTNNWDLKNLQTKVWYSIDTWKNGALVMNNSNTKFLKKSFRVFESMSFLNELTDFYEIGGICLHFWSSIWFMSIDQKSIKRSQVMGWKCFLCTASRSLIFPFEFWPLVFEVS